jgi:DNA-binding NarL/FixJ family response regulator
LIADDDPLARFVLSAILRRQADVEVIGEARGGREALEKTLQLRPDLLLLDADTPGQAGLEVVRQLVRQRAPVRILLLTEDDAPETPLEALYRGARGFLGKSWVRSHLPQAVRAVAAGDIWLDPPTTARLFRNAALGARASSARLEPQRTLTPREQQVNAYLQQGLSHAEIASALAIGLSTVKSHVRQILRKGRAQNRAGSSEAG